MVKKITKYLKFVVCCALIMSLVAPSYAALSASDGSAFVTKAEFDSALADFNARLTTFEAGINSKIDSQVSSYLDRNGIWNGKDWEFENLTLDHFYTYTEATKKYVIVSMDPAGFCTDSWRQDNPWNKSRNVLIQPGSKKSWRGRLNRIMDSEKKAVLINSPKSGLAVGFVSVISIANTFTAKESAINVFKQYLAGDQQAGGTVLEGVAYEASTSNRAFEGSTIIVGYEVEISNSSGVVKSTDTTSVGTSPCQYLQRQDTPNTTVVFKQPTGTGHWVLRWDVPALYNKDMSVMRFVAKGDTLSFRLYTDLTFVANSVPDGIAQWPFAFANSGNNYAVMRDFVIY